MTVWRINISTQKEKQPLRCARVFTAHLTRLFTLHKEYVLFDVCSQSFDFPFTLVTKSLWISIPLWRSFRCTVVLTGREERCRSLVNAGVLLFKKKRERESKEHRKSNAGYFSPLKKVREPLPVTSFFLCSPLFLPFISSYPIFFVIRRWFRETKWETTEKNNWKENLNWRNR